MKLLWWGLALAALAGAGCVDDNLLRPGRPVLPAAKTKATPVVAPPVSRGPLPVTPDQVTPGNAPAKAEELRQEMDREQWACPTAGEGQACTCGRH